MPLHTSLKVHPMWSHLNLAAVISICRDSLGIQPGNHQAPRGRKSSMLTAKTQMCIPCINPERQCPLTALVQTVAPHNQVSG